MSTMATHVVSLVIAAAGLALTGCGGQAAQENAADSPSNPTGRGLIGNRAPDFSIDRVPSGGARISLAKLRGKVVIVDFWGTFCQPCKKSFPKLQELSAKYARKGLEIVAISEDEADDRDKIPDFASEFGAKFAIAWDADKSVAQRYNPPTMPSAFIIDRKGRVRYAHAGYHDGDDEEIETELKGLLNEN